jgi:hypothetical protein
MTQALENLETKHKVKLSIPLVASYLARGVKRTQIARICNISNAAVYDYCDRHYEELAPLIDTTDSIMTMKAKHIAEKAQERILGHLNETEKKDLFALNAISGTHIDKMRLLSDKSTQNISMEINDANMAETSAAIKACEARIKALTGEIEAENLDVIDV